MKKNEFNEELKAYREAWCRQARRQQQRCALSDEEILALVHAHRRTPYGQECRRCVRQGLSWLAALALCGGVAALCLTRGAVAPGILWAAGGLPCLWAMVAAGRRLYLLRHIHPVKCSPATVERYLEKICRLEALRRLRRRRLSSLLRLPAAPSPRTLRWAGAAGAACLLLVVALCLWQLPQPAAPAPRAAQQLASTSAPQPAPPAAPATNPAAPVAAGRQAPSLTSTLARHSNVRRAAAETSAAMSASEPAQMAEAAVPSPATPSPALVPAVPMELSIQYESCVALSCNDVISCDATGVVQFINAVFAMTPHPNKAYLS